MKGNPVMATASRYTLLLDDGALRSVERLQSTYGFKTKADVYDLAIRVLTWATEQHVGGYEVGRYRSDEFQPLLLPYEINGQAWRLERSNGVAAHA
jgi:hypothetical protein